MKEMKFEEWAEEWLGYKKYYVKESTYANYLITMVNHIIPAFHGLSMEQISTKVVQNTVLMWSKTGRLNKKGGLALKTIKDMMIILKMCLSDFEDYYDLEIKLKKIEYPCPGRSGEKEILTKCQQNQMLEAVKDHLEYETLGYIISLYTGIRIGELCALKWEDVDMINKEIKVNKTLQRIYLKSSIGGGKTKIIITPPKSEKSIRVIPISKILFELLKRMQPKNGDYYVLTGNLKHIEPRLYRKHYDKFLKEHHLRVINFHGLRHTFATRCVEAGADYKIVSELLGHSSIALTLNLYVHPQMEDKRKCVELI